MSKVESFLNPAQEQLIVEAIRMAETDTSGEIRVHIEEKADKLPFDRALEVFHMLGMDNTAQRNGVLIYIAVGNKKFVVLGDKGINEKVPEDFWDSEKNLMETYFRKNQFAEGISKAVLEIGMKLREFFPYKTNDRNELTDEISKG